MKGIWRRESGENKANMKGLLHDAAVLFRCLFGFVLVIELAHVFGLLTVVVALGFYPACICYFVNANDAADN